MALTVDRVELAARVLVLESLKKRRCGIYRAVPVRLWLLEALNLVHGIRELHGRRGDPFRSRAGPPVYRHGLCASEAAGGQGHDGLGICVGHGI